ncbi:MAG: peptide ABC transporter substrate-binding protein [Pseudomonadota bacterium]
MRRFLVFAAVVLASVAACTDATQAPEYLRRGLSADPATLDPQHARSVAALKVLGDVYEGLLTRDASGNSVPGAAQSWEVSGDGTRYTFTLRDDARWQDGSPVTAADFLRGWRHLADPANAAFYADLLRPVVGADAIAAGDAAPNTLGIAAPDIHTVVITLTRPQADFLQRLGHPALVPRHVDAEPPFANGAYEVVERGPGRILLERNVAFHAAGSVAIGQVEYRAFEQEATEYRAFRAGELDITSRVPREVFRLPETERPEVRFAPYLGTVFLTFNMRDAPPLSLRRALSLAVDREALAAAVVGRGEQPAYGLVPPGIANGTASYAPLAEGDMAAEYRDRVALAKTLTGDTPQAITLAYATSDENRVVAAALQAMWREALPNVNVTLENREFRVLLAQRRAGDFEGLMRASWIADFDDAAQFLDILRSGHPANGSGFTDTRFDTLMDAAGYTDSAERRADTLRAAEAILADQVPVIPLYHFVSKHAVAPRVTGWRDNLLDLHYSRYLELTGAGDEVRR